MSLIKGDRVSMGMSGLAVVACDSNLSYLRDGDWEDFSLRPAQAQS
jgi:hypothetical protein